jgi:hypothetical protein
MKLRKNKQPNNIFFDKIVKPFLAFVKKSFSLKQKGLGYAQKNKLHFKKSYSGKASGGCFTGGRLTWSIHLGRVR